MSPWIVVAVTVALIALSAFFVVIEFALLGARKHRLEETASTDRSARAALKSMNELTVMLAGAQLGITACTFALGAITKPAIDYALAPVFESVGIPSQVAGVASFVLSLLLVTFLHLVVGEMAPKSWAIAHPELAARLIGRPTRAYIWPLRPFLLWVNAIANLLVRRSGVEPVDRAAVGGRDAETIRHLVEYSREVGVLEPELQQQLSQAIELQSLTVADMASATTSPTSVGAAATVGELGEVARRTGHLRILIATDDAAAGYAVVHVRDTLLAEDDRPAADFARPVHRFSFDAGVHEALTTMRDRSVQLAVVERDGALVGVVTLTDIIRRILPGDAVDRAVST